MRDLARTRRHAPFRLLFLMALMGHWMPAQCREGMTPTANDFSPPKRLSRFSAPELIREFDSELDSFQRLGEGDRLTIDVWNHDDLSGPHIIGPDGQVTLPVAGDLALAGLSREEALAAVEAGLGKFYRDLNVTVRVDEYASNQILILGRVAKPGAIVFPTRPTLLKAIALAGGLPVGGAGAEKASLTRCAVFRGKDRVAWIDLGKLLKGEDLSLNIRLRPNDVVYVPDSNDQLVYVMGEVGSPGAYQLAPEMTLLDALALAGGPTQDSADKLLIVRPEQKLSRELKISELLKAKINGNYSLQEGDTLYVPRRGLAKVGYFLQQLSPVSGFLFFATAWIR